MFGRIDLFERRTFTSQPPITYARVLLVWLMFTQVCSASLYLYTSDNSKIIFSTVDFMWVNSCDYGYVNGSLVIASFLGDKSDPCTLNPVPDNTSILLVPFEDGLNNGCSSYSDVILSNPWLQIPRDIPGLRSFHVIRRSIYAPQCPSTVVIFTSTNNGDPGVRERYMGDSRFLSKARSALVLIRTVDAAKVINLFNETSNAMVTRDNGSWIMLLNSKGLLIWSIVFGILYGCVAVSAFYLTSVGIYKHGLTLTNPRPWLLMGVGLSSAIMLEYDPWAMHYDRLSELQYEIVQMSGYFILCICYAIFLFPWIKATRNISEELDYRTPLVRKLCRVFHLGLFFAVLVKSVALIFCLFGFTPTINIKRDISKIIYIVMESVFTFFAIFTYAIFGIIMVLARKCEHDSIRQNANAQIRRSRTYREIVKSGILTISLILSLLFITVHTIFTIFLPPTIHNFWIVRILDDLSLVFGCLVLLIALQYNAVGKYSHMLYTGSSDENATESTVSPPISRDSSFHNSNNSGAEATDSRGKRNTVEILFGRRSLGF
ncbi:16894_t:CDS:2 [Acaulospora morrowiae]|uniref:16894_t:CDS:1 n=1 Tax=Acaulospora morrowiae TaxID=94023 RepID=A0A9N9CX23_9GLOM|nr:16894_t:CDS:2 [Acaulospora morrowiae]